LNLCPLKRTWCKFENKFSNIEISARRSGHGGVKMNLIGYAMRMAKEYYDEATYGHAARVAQYVSENNMIPEDRLEDCIALAWMHDLLEDTDYNANGLPNHMYDCLQILTKPESEDYISYIKKIKKQANNYREAYWVKLADMKDHLLQTETLTEKLKEKYLMALPYLL